MALTPTHTTLTVTTAGTRVQCTADTGERPTAIYFEAAKTNTGNIYIGLVTVSSTVYITCLPAGEGFTLSSPRVGNYRSGSAGIQLSDIYVDASVSGEKVQMSYLYSQGA